MEAYLAVQATGYQEIVSRGELCADDDVRMRYVRASLVQLNWALRNAIAQFAERGIERHEPDAVAERRADQPPIGAEAQLLDEPATDVRLFDEVSQPLAVFWHLTILPQRGRRTGGGSGWPGRVVGGRYVVRPQEDERPGRVVAATADEDRRAAGIGHDQTRVDVHGARVVARAFGGHLGVAVPVQDVGVLVELRDGSSGDADTDVAETEARRRVGG